ncbi:DedA family protein [Pseudoxanthomonas sp. NC8]|nr:DedA family protein [Pseudoxanthomonas sp. NC8]
MAGADIAVLGGLFLAAFLAATLLPMQSEALLVALLLAGYPPATLVVVASTGNILGSMLNWWLGRELLRFRNRRWFPVSAPALARARRGYRRWGRWSLLLSWLPVIGDPLTFAAGVLREPLRVFVPLVVLAKSGRYPGARRRHLALRLSRAPFPPCRCLRPAPVAEASRGPRASPRPLPPCHRGAVSRYPRRIAKGGIGR